jgi:K+-sensing histidine kinase KdpD
LVKRQKSKELYESQHSSDESRKSDASKFEKQHRFEDIYAPHNARDKIVIKVVDTGKGIKKKDRLKLFKLFGTLQNTRQMNTQGIGLGLVISENIVKAFNGVIGVKSKYNHGTKFAFSIVIGKDDDYQESG